jgi:tripartite-type tricarboxylate transporter receptor subunit TctC
MKFRLLFSVFAAAALFAALIPARAADYPTKPIKLIVPYVPGATGDLAARLFASQVERRWKQTAIVDYKPGANTMLGSEFVAHGPTDGYTLLINSDSLAYLHLLVKAMPIDPMKDLVPASIIGSFNFVILVPGDLPPNNFREFIAYAKANPGKLNYGSPGGSPVIEVENLKWKLGFEATSILYKGGAAAASALLANEVQLMMGSPAQAAQFAKAGKLKALAIAGPRRHPLIPDVPTLQESGFPGIESGSWIGLFAPAGIAPDILAKLSGQIAELSKTPEAIEKLQAIGWEATPTTSEQTIEIMRRLDRRATEIATRVGIQPE